MRYSCYIFFYFLIIPFSIRGNSNSNSIRNQVDEELLCECATSKSLFIYLSHTLNILNIAHVCREENNRKTHVKGLLHCQQDPWLKIENSFGITTEQTYKAKRAMQSELEFSTLIKTRFGLPQTQRVNIVN